MLLQLVAHDCTSRQLLDKSTRRSGLPYHNQQRVLSMRYTYELMESSQEAKPGAQRDGTVCPRLKAVPRGGRVHSHNP